MGEADERASHRAEGKEEVRLQQVSETGEKRVLRENDFIQTAIIQIHIMQNTRNMCGNKSINLKQATNLTGLVYKFKYTMHQIVPY